MKKLLSILTLIVFIAAFTLVQPHQLQAKKIKSIEKNSFFQVTENLDAGGSFYMYMSSEKLIKFLEEFIGVIKQIALSEAKKTSDKEEIEVGFTFLSRLLKDSGLFEISGIGMSSIKMQNGFNHDKTIIHHYKGMDKGLIWHLSGASPHAFDSQNLLPANTAFAGFSDSNPGYLWQWLQKEAAQSGIPKLREGITAVTPMLMSKGIDPEALLGSLAGHSGVIITLDDSKLCQFPVKGFTLEFPDPALAIVIYVKDDSIFNMLQKFVPVPPQVDGKIKKIIGPVLPLPITLNPMIVYDGNLLILASNGKIADEILARKSGLLKTTEFKNLSVNMPVTGNGFTFLSARMFKTVTDIRTKAIAASPDKESQTIYAAFERLNLLPKDLAFYSVKQNAAEGFIYTSNNNLPLGSAALLPAIAVGGIVTAIAVPNLLTAVQKGKQKATMGDMRMISLAVDQYIADKGAAPQGNTLVDIESELVPFYLKKLPLTDAWGFDFHYISGMEGKKDAYCIGSGGKDGVFQGWQQGGFYKVKDVKHFNKDIIICGSAFTLGPKVK